MRNSSKHHAQVLLYQRLDLLREQWNGAAAALTQAAGAAVNAHLRLQNLPAEAASARSGKATWPRPQPSADRPRLELEDSFQAASAHDSDSRGPGPGANILRASPSPSHDQLVDDREQPVEEEEAGQSRATQLTHLRETLGPSLELALQRLSEVFGQFQDLLVRRRRLPARAVSGSAPQEDAYLGSVLAAHRQELFLKATIVDQLLEACVRRGYASCAEDDHDPDQRVSNEGLELLLLSLQEQPFVSTPRVPRP